MRRDPAPHDPARRRVIIGLAGLVAAGVAGGTVAWLRFSQAAPARLTPIRQAEPTPTSMYDDQNFDCYSVNVVVASSSVLTPLVWNVAKNLQTKCLDFLVEVEEAGGLLALAAVEAGLAQIGTSEVFKTAHQRDLVDHQITGIMYTLLVNQDVTGVSSLSTPQLRAIFTGQIQNWKQVGGPDLALTVLTHPLTSGARANFERYVLGGPETLANDCYVLGEPETLTNDCNPNFNLYTDSPDVVIPAVQQTSGAPSYVALPPAWPTGVKTLHIDGYGPVASAVRTFSYPFWSIGHMYTRGPADRVIQFLIDYMSSPDGKAIAVQLSFLPLDDLAPELLATHQAV